MIYYSYIDRFERKINSKNKNKPEEIYSECGKSIGEIYEYQIVEGIKLLVPCGTTDRQEFIESFAESQDINNIIQKFLNGDESVLNVKHGTYGDFRNVPKSYAEMFERLQTCNNIFNSLPVEVKEKFENSPEKFWSDFGSENFDNVFNEYVSSFESDESEVVDNAE